MLFCAASEDYLEEGFYIRLNHQINSSVIDFSTLGVFTWIRIEFQSGSNSFRFCWDHRGLNYICLHESGLSCNSFRIEFISFFIPDWTLDPKWNVDSGSCKLGSKFYSWMKFGMKSTFIMAEIKIVCKMGSFIHVSKCISGKIRLLVHESQTSFNPAWMRFWFAVIFQSLTQSSM